jgi:hypothetical protein
LDRRGQKLEQRPGSGHLRDSSEKQRQIIGSEARVELTVEIDPAVCNATKAKLNARRKAVTHLTSQLRKGRHRRTDIQLTLRRGWSMPSTWLSSAEHRAS